jgi:hypothetical protein
MALIDFKEARRMMNQMIEAGFLDIQVRCRDNRWVDLPARASKMLA